MFASQVARRALALCSAAATVTHTRTLSAQEGGDNTGPLRASRTSTPPRIDGRLNDDTWQQVPARTDFVRFAPIEGGTPSFRTEAKIAYDNKTLYVAVRAFDAHPDSIIRRLGRRDTWDQTSDQILLFIDSYHDRRTGYQFVITAGGVKYDALLFDDSQQDPTWDGTWDAAVRFDDAGWVAEFAIPLRLMRFVQRDAPTFGFMIGRWVGRTGERASLPQYRRSRSGLASQLGDLVGLESLTGAGGLDVTPYVLANRRNAATANASARALDAKPAGGADLKWLPRPSISIDATLNPDFGQVEADPAILNLSGTEVFQAERRPFFLEAPGMLTVPLAPDGSGLMFYSRRIGRRPALYDLVGNANSPTETTILGATRVTARLSPTLSVAGLSAFTQREYGAARSVIEPEAHYGVARLQQDMRKGRSGLGFMLTRVDRNTADGGVAANLPRSASAGLVTTQHQTASGNYQLSGWGALSNLEGSPRGILQRQLSLVHAWQRPDDGITLDSTRRTMSGAAGELTFAKIGGGLTRFHSAYRWVGPGFDINEMGFLTVSAAARTRVAAGLKNGSASRVFGVPYQTAELWLAYSGDQATNGERLPNSRGLALTGTMLLQSQALVMTTLSVQLPGGYCTITCTRGGPALRDPPRTTATLDVTGDPRRTVVPHVNLEYDRDDEGQSHGYGGTAEVTWHIRGNLDASLAAYAFDALYSWFYYGRYGSALSDTAHYAVAALNLPTRSVTARTNWTLSPAMTLQWYGQAYVSRGAYSNVRLIANPRAKVWAERFRRFGDTLVTAAPGGIDYKQFRSNLVFRWEYRPGSALFAVWSQGREVSGSTPSTLGLWPGRDLRDLFSTRPLNVFAIKASYRVAL